MVTPSGFYYTLAAGVVEALTNSYSEEELKELNLSENDIEIEKAIENKELETEAKNYENDKQCKIQTCELQSMVL